MWVWPALPGRLSSSNDIPTLTGLYIYQHVPVLSTPNGARGGTLRAQQDLSELMDTLNTFGRAAWVPEVSYQRPPGEKALSPRGETREEGSALWCNRAEGIKGVEKGKFGVACEECKVWRTGRVCICLYQPTLLSAFWSRVVHGSLICPFGTWRKAGWPSGA